MSNSQFLVGSKLCLLQKASMGNFFSSKRHWNKWMIKWVIHHRRYCDSCSFPPLHFRTSTAKDRQGLALLAYLYQPSLYILIRKISIESASILQLGTSREMFLFLFFAPQCINTWLILPLWRYSMRFLGWHWWEKSVWKLKCPFHCGIWSCFHCEKYIKNWMREEEKRVG